MSKVRLKVELAETPEELSYGLMFRKELGENDGMLFKFGRSENLKFWGLNTYIPLSVAFVDENDIIKKIDYISPLSTRVIESEKKCNKAIEANYDFFYKNHISVGDIVYLEKEKENLFLYFE